MGTSASVFTEGGKYICISMKQFGLVLCLVPLALGQYYGKPVAGSVAPSCVTQYTNSASQVCTSVPKKECSTEIIQSSKTVTEQSCSTEFKQVPEQKCTTSQEQKCELVSKQVPEQQCSTQSKYVPQTTYSTQCSDVVSTACDSVATTAVGAGVYAGSSVGFASPSGLAGAALGLGSSAGLSQLYRGKREAKADPQLFYKATPVCRQVTQKQCKQVPITTQRAVSTPVCNTVSKTVQEQVCKLEPKQNCQTIVKSIPEQKCTTTPVTKCIPVSKQVPISTPVEKCQTSLTPSCRTINEQVPRTVCSQKAVAIGRGYALSGSALGGPGLGGSVLGGSGPTVAQPVSTFANKVQG